MRMLDIKEQIPMNDDDTFKKLRIRRAEEEKEEKKQGLSKQKLKVMAKELGIGLRKGLAKAGRTAVRSVGTGAKVITREAIKQGKEYGQKFKEQIKAEDEMRKQLREFRQQERATKRIDFAKQRISQEEENRAMKMNTTTTGFRTFTPTKIKPTEYSTPRLNVPLFEGRKPIAMTPKLNVDIYKKPKVSPNLFMIRKSKIGMGIGKSKLKLYEKRR